MGGGGGGVSCKHSYVIYGRGASSAIFPISQYARVVGIWGGGLEIRMQTGMVAIQILRKIHIWYLGYLEDRKQWHAWLATLSCDLRKKKRKKKKKKKKRKRKKTTKGSFEKLHIDRKNLLFHCKNHQDAHQGKSSNQCKGAESVKHLILLCLIKS